MNAHSEKQSFEDAEVYEGEEERPDAGGDDQAVAEEAKPAKRRRPLRKALMIALPLVLALGGAYVWVTGGRFIETENAYVHQDRVTVMPQVSGQIAQVAVAENAFVDKGALLFTIDDAVYRNAVESDRAKLEAARLDVQRLKAAYQQAVSDRQSQSDAEGLAQTTFDRQNALVGKGVISASVVDDARLRLQQAKQALASADQEVLSAKAALGGNPDIEADKHPEVLQALAALHSAELDLTHTKIYAPEAGVVSQTDWLQEGQYVTPSSSVMSLVETEDSWIEANYKETDLTNMRVGQPVELSFDTYPDHSFEGRIASIGAGTGSEFALLPAQNATGNWVKVVQRVPVRITLDKSEDTPPLRAGMSATTSVDTGQIRGVPSFIEPAVAAIGLDHWIGGRSGHQVATNDHAAAHAVAATEASGDGTADTATASQGR